MKSLNPLFILIVIHFFYLSSILCNNKQKLSRNYASYECGSKVIASNSEAEGISRILSESKDEYMLNPCKAKIWFVIELCEPIQPSSLELANFELFSSGPKELLIQGSERYPTNKWVNLGTFAATETRELQRFDIKSPQVEFLKFIRVDMLSHYGSEHFCPLSLVRAFGTSLVEEFDAIESGGKSADGLNQDDMDSLDSSLTEESIGTEQASQNILGSARDAVISMVRRATSVLTKGSPNESVVDAVISDSFRTHQKALKAMPHVESYINRSDCVKFPRNESNTTIISRPCLYLESVLGLEVYQVICDELLKSPELRFKCEPTGEASCNKTTLNSSVPFLSLTPTDSIRSDENQSEYSLQDSTSPEQMDSNLTLNNNNINQPQPPTESESATGPSPSHPSSDTVNPTPVVEPPLVSGSSASSTPETVTESGTTQSPDGVIKESAASGSVVSEASKQNSAETTTETPPVQSSSTPASTSGQPPQPTAATPSVASTNGGNQGSVLAASSSKESIFIKLNNRIKALEQNLSNSNQILEDLFTRHREHVTHVQAAFNQTNDMIHDGVNQSVTRDNQMSADIMNIQEKLDDVSEKVYLLVSEKENFHSQLIAIHIILMIIEITAVMIVVSLFLRRIQRIPRIEATSVGPQPLPERLQRSMSEPRDTVYRSTPSKRPLTEITNSSENNCQPAKTQKLDAAKKEEEKEQKTQKHAVPSNHLEKTQELSGRSIDTLHTLNGPQVLKPTGDFASKVLADSNRSSSQPNLVPPHPASGSSSITSSSPTTSKKKVPGGKSSSSGHERNASCHSTTSSNSSGVSSISSALSSMNKTTLVQNSAAGANHVVSAAVPEDNHLMQQHLHHSKSEPFVAGDKQQHPPAPDRKGSTGSSSGGSNSSFSFRKLLGITKKP